MKIKGIPHVAIIVKKLEDHEDFYTSAFCLKTPPAGGLC